MKIYTNYIYFNLFVYKNAYFLNGHRYVIQANDGTFFMDLKNYGSYKVKMG